MAKFTNQQRLEIIKNYYGNSQSVVANLRALTPIFGRNNSPTRQAVRTIVNKQNMRHWSATNPNVLLETPLHPQKVTVWCSFHAGGVIGERYRATLEHYFRPSNGEFVMNDL